MSLSIICSIFRWSGRINYQIGTEFTNTLLGNTDFSDVELMMDNEGLFISGLQMFQSGNHDNDIPLTAYHCLQGQIGEQFAPTSVNAAYFNPWKRRHRIQ